MKTYKHLYDEFMSTDNIKLAAMNASLGKRDRKEVKYFMENIDARIDEIRYYATHFKNYKHTPKVITDGMRKKERIIIVPAFKEQIIHHMLVNVLKPVFFKGMYEHSYGSIPDRGLHLAKERIKKWVSHDVKNTKYFCKLDIRHFFNTIPHDILKQHLSRKIKDDKLLEVLFKVIDVQEDGLPLGFYTSQWLANWYLQELDHYIKENLKIKYYVRYMDDMVLFSSSKRKLHKAKDAIKAYLKDELGLEMKPNWRISLFVYEKNGATHGSDLDFMGFRFFRNKVILRKSLMLRTTRLVGKIRKEHRCTVHRARQFMSYLGWISHSNTYGMFKKWIKPYVSVRYMKKIIGRFERLRSKLQCGTTQLIQTT